MSISTSGLIVKNAAVSLVNGVYNTYSSNTNGRRWLSSDKVCLLHYTVDSTYSRSGVDQSTYFTQEMLANKYYKYNTVEKTCNPVNLEVSKNQTIDDQLGNNDKALLVESTDAAPRNLNATEISLGQTGEIKYWMHDKTVPVGTTDPKMVLDVVVTFSGLQDGDTAYIQVETDGIIDAVENIAKTVAYIGDKLTVHLRRSGASTEESAYTNIQYPNGTIVSYTCDVSNGIVITNEHTAEDSRIASSDVEIQVNELQTVQTVETRKKCTIVRDKVSLRVSWDSLPPLATGAVITCANAAGTTLKETASTDNYITYSDLDINSTVTITAAVQYDNGVTRTITGDIVVEHASDGEVSYTIDMSGTNLQFTNNNTFSTVSYTGVLCYSSPIYVLAVETNLNRWSISRASIKETGLETTGELYCAFAEENTVDPWSGLSWVCTESGSSTVDTNITLEYWDESSVQSSTTTSTDADGATRTVTTFVNIATGETYTDTQVVREKTIYNQQDTVRYDYVNLAIGKIYRFRFVSEFESLGWIPNNTTQPYNAGVYKVDSIMSYYDSVIGRIDIFTNLYEPCGVSKTVFDSDKKRFADTVIYRLVDPTDESKVYFMPQIFIEGQPDASVLKYNKLMMTVDLGVQPNSNTVSSLVDTTHPAVNALNRINEMSSLFKKVLEKEYGLAPTSENPLVQFSVYGHVWLTDDAFKSIETDRNATMSRSTVDFNTVFRCDESNRWYLENLKLQARLNNQNELIARLLAKRTGN